MNASEIDALPEHTVIRITRQRDWKYVGRERVTIDPVTDVDVLIKIGRAWSVPGIEYYWYESGADIVDQGYEVEVLARPCELVLNRLAQQIEECQRIQREGPNGLTEIGRADLMTLTYIRDGVWALPPARRGDMS